MTFSSDTSAPQGNLSLAEKEELSEACAALARRCAEEAGDYLRAAFRQRTVAEEKLGYFDIVTEHDRRSEEMIAARILREMPGSRVVGEEGEPRGSGELVWYVDPIDGTSNFASGLPFYCVSIGVAYAGELIAGIVYDPERGELFTATLRGADLNGEPLRPSEVRDEHDALYLVSWPHEGRSSRHDEAGLFDALLGSARAVRRLGSAALGLAWVAAGRADAASELLVKPWDVAAGFFLVERAGGRVVRGREREPEPHEREAWYSPRYVASGPELSMDGTALGRIIAV